MNKNWKITALVAGVVLSLGLSVWTFVRSPRVAYVNTVKVFGEFAFKKELEKKLEKVQKAEQKELDSLKIELKVKIDLIKLKKIKEGKEIVEYSRAEQQYFLKEKQYNEDYQQQSDQYTQQVWKQLNQYIKDYGKKNSYRYIFGTKGEGDIMYASEADEITDELLQYVNARYEGDENAK